MSPASTIVRTAMLCAATVITLGPLRAGAQCAAEHAVTCPARNEVLISLGYSTEGTAPTFAWTNPRRIGAYARLFPTLNDRINSAPNSTSTAESAREFGVTYRLRADLTIGLGYSSKESTRRQFGALDPVTFDPLILDESRSSTSGPSLFLAYAFAPPATTFSFAVAASLGTVGSGIAVGTSVRFPVLAGAAR